MKIMLTGAAGFIGMHTTQKLLARGDEVLGVDSLNTYYDPALKQDRLAQLTKSSNFRFAHVDLSDAVQTQALFDQFKPQRVIHLAAQPGVRYSLSHPQTCLQNNIMAFGNVLEACRQHAVEHLVFASSSSVYGSNTKMPYAPSDPVDHPLSLYAASKKANELMAHTYSHVYGLPVTGLRYFTVYGPWGRPDMAPWLFTRAILNGEPIKVFNHGHMTRDFTFVDDIAEGSVCALDSVATACATFSKDSPLPDTSHAPYRIHNIGHQTPVPLMDFIHTLEGALGVKAVLNYLPMQAGDVPNTSADMTSLQQLTGYQATTDIKVGLTQWANWYREIGHRYQAF